MSPTSSSSTSPSTKSAPLHHTTTTTTPVLVASPYSRNAVLEDTFDDACDAGQFCMSPCWYIFVRLERAWARRQEAKRQTKSRQQHERDNGDKENEDSATPTNNESFLADAAERTRKTIFLSRIQQSIYVICFYVVWVVVAVHIYPRIRASTRISSVHASLGDVLFTGSLVSYMAAKLSSPGTITPETMSKYDNYAYENVLYMSDNNICPTLGIRKLARSKYDRFSQTHVPRFDHYCGWLGKSIGEENYRYFLAFVFSHTILATYGTVILGALLWADGWNVAIASVAIISAMFSGLAIIHSTFHMTLVIRGQTTNEYYKWQQLLEANGALCNENNSNNNNVSSNQRPVSSAMGSANMEDMECHALAPTPTSYLSSSTSPFSSSSSEVCQQQNFYNLGLVGNIHEVLFPRSLRRRGDDGSKKDS